MSSTLKAQLWHGRERLSCHFTLLEVWRFYPRGDGAVGLLPHPGAGRATEFSCWADSSLLLSPSALMENDAVIAPPSTAKELALFLGKDELAKGSECWSFDGFCCCFLGFFPLPFSSSCPENPDCILWGGGPEQWVSTGIICAFMTLSTWPYSQQSLS